MQLFAKCTPKGSNRLVAGGGVTGTAYTFTLQPGSVIVSFRISKDEKNEKTQGLFEHLKKSETIIRKRFAREMEEEFGDAPELRLRDAIRAPEGEPIGEALEKSLELVTKFERFDYIRILLRKGGHANKEAWDEIQERMVRTMHCLNAAIEPVMDEFYRA